MNEITVENCSVGSSNGSTGPPTRDGSSPSESANERPVYLLKEEESVGRKEGRSKPMFSLYFVIHCFLPLKKKKGSKRDRKNSYSHSDLVSTILSPKTNPKFHQKIERTNQIKTLAIFL